MFFFLSFLILLTFRTICIDYTYEAGDATRLQPRLYRTTTTITLPRQTTTKTPRKEFEQRQQQQETAGVELRATDADEGQGSRRDVSRALLV